MELPANQRGPLILWFHVLAFGTLAADILYQRFNVFTQGSRTYGGRWKFLTHINEFLQLMYFSLAIVGDVLSLLLKNQTNQTNNNKGQTSNNSIVIKLQDFMFVVVIFPIGGLVSFMFWAIYAYDRELIHPIAMDAIVPRLCNHIMHTVVLVFMLLEVFITHHRYPSYMTSLVAIFFLPPLYYAWMIVQVYMLSEWPYSFLEHFTAVQHVAFLLVCFAFICMFHFLGRYCTSLRENLLASQAKQNAKAA